MPTIIQRLKLEAEFEIEDGDCHYFACFHTNGDVGDEMPTTILYNGQEYSGDVNLCREDDILTIVVRMNI
jgi:hypothetical protein